MVASNFGFPFLAWPWIATSLCSYGSEHKNIASHGRRWVEETSTAEVVESRGKLWLATGVIRAGKLYCNVEEIGYVFQLFDEMHVSVQHLIVLAP